MRFYDTRVLLLPRDGVNVQWQVEPENDDLSLVEIELQRSESPHGPFTVIQTLDPLTSFSFTDHTAPWRSKNFELYYQLVGRLRSSGEAVSSCPAFSFQGQLTLDAVEIIRQHHILLYGVNGHEPLTGIVTTVYKRRTFGPRCRTCTDESTGQVVISQCRECGGTGFASGGYYQPIAVNMNFQPHPKLLQISNMGKSEDNETTVFTTNFPIFYPGDMVVEPSEKHWRVVQAEVTERKRVVVHQLLRLRQLDHNDVEYEVFRHLDNGEVS